MVGKEGRVVKCPSLACGVQRCGWPACIPTCGRPQPRAAALLRGTYKVLL